MTEYVDKNRVLGLLGLNHNDYVYLDKRELAKRIEKLPTIDAVEAVHGEWINHFDDLFPEESTIECSMCHEHQPIGIDDNFCPNCGARMKGADE